MLDGVPAWAYVVIVLLLAILWKLSKLVDHIVPEEPTFEDKVTDAAIAAMEEGVPREGLIEASEFGQAVATVLHDQGHIEMSNKVKAIMQEGRFVLNLARFNEELRKRGIT